MIDLIKACIKAWRVSGWMPPRLIMAVDPASPEGDICVKIWQQGDKIIKWELLE